MKLIETVKISEHQTMAIYQLSDKTAEKFKKAFVLSSSEFSDYWLSHHSEEEIAENLKDYYYEDLFETRLEAYLTAKLVQASHEMLRVRTEIERLRDIRVAELKW